MGGCTSRRGGGKTRRWKGGSSRGLFVGQVGYVGVVVDVDAVDCHGKIREVAVVFLDIVCGRRHGRHSILLVWVIGFVMMRVVCGNVGSLSSTYGILGFSLLVSFFIVNGRMIGIGSGGIAATRKGLNVVKDVHHVSFVGGVFVPPIRRRVCVLLVAFAAFFLEGSLALQSLLGCRRRCVFNGNFGCSVINHVNINGIAMAGVIAILVIRSLQSPSPRQHR
mmetsp:Transcript_29742/g.56722  ORF Transcript_29742/g.56722 Transcript_29742/m.56722 type:complete len:221 (-) Transcript_29742:250-912(-)